MSDGSGGGGDGAPLAALLPPLELTVYDKARDINITTLLLLLLLSVRVMSVAGCPPAPSVVATVSVVRL